MYVAVQGIFFGIPILLLVATSLRQYELGQPTGGYTLANYATVLTSSTFLPALLRSVTLSLLIAVVSVILALATVLGSWRFARRTIRDAILLTCAVMFFAGIIPRVSATAFLLSANGPFGTIWQTVAPWSDGSLLYSTGGVILASLPLVIPLGIIALHVARHNVPASYVDAGADLGAGWLVVQRRVVLPLMRPGVIVAFLVAFILSLGDVVVVDLVGGSQIYTAALSIIDYTKIDDWGSAAAAAVVALAVVVTAVGGATWLLLRSL
ncbi:MAG: ABC transporter permease subunit [Planctomycetes bacterium]|nr:ABC transporter permease subunit [Planctomycetota bacterium]